MDNTSNIQDQLGVPPVPPMPPLGTAPELSPVDAMAAELTNTGAPEMIIPTAADAPAEAPAAEPAAEATATLDALVAPAPAAEEPAPVADATVAPLEAPAAVEAAPAPVATPEVSGDLEAVRKSMLKDLFPLMDKVSMSSDQRYRVYHEMIEDSGDKSYIAGAYEAAKGIEDETAKAEALLFLVEQSDK